MMVKMFLALLLFILASLTGVCPLTEIDSKAGEMVSLFCPNHKRYDQSDTKVNWISHTPQKMYVTNDISSAELAQISVLLHGRRLYILNASVNHQGNYSCSVGNSSRQFWFMLTVNTAKSKECEDMNKYTKSCYIQESCKLFCPHVNVPPYITKRGTTWHKEGDLVQNRGYFTSVEEKDQGIYICTRSFLYHGQTYNKTFTVELVVKPRKLEMSPVIVEPRNNAVIDVDLGSEVVIDCKAITNSEFDGVLWYRGHSLVDKNTSSPVFYNFTRGKNAGEVKIKASLVFKKVSEEDLSKNYTCKLDSVYQASSFATISITQKARPSYISLASSIAGIVVIMAVTVVIYLKLKVDITLFLRDTLGCYRRTSDGKSYDAFFLCYKSDTDPGLNTHDRKWLERVLEEKFGYSLCLYDRDVLPGKAIAEAVLDCVEQSRTVILVPTSPDPGLGSGLLSTVHAALVERQTRLIFIKTESMQVSTSGSMNETLQFLSDAGLCVTWKGISTMSSSSSFWKQLRYYLPPLRHASNIRLLPQTKF